MPKFKTKDLTVSRFKSSPERVELWNRFCKWSRMRGDDYVADSLAKAITDAMEGWNGLPLRPEEKKEEPVGV